MRTRTVLLTTLLALPLLLAGCVDGYEPAHVPQGELPEDWVEGDTLVKGGEGDLRVTIHPYRSRDRVGGDGPPRAAVAVASLNDLPVVDEQRLLEEAREDQVDRLLNLLRTDPRVERVELSNWVEGSHVVRDGEEASTRTARLTAVVTPSDGGPTYTVTGNVTLWHWQDADQPMWVMAAGYALNEDGATDPWPTVQTVLSDRIACHQHG